MALQKNKVYRAEIMDYTTDGSGVARIDGMAGYLGCWRAFQAQRNSQDIAIRRSIRWGRMRMEPILAFTVRIAMIL